ncbi:MAG: thiamine pyrophosphate-binding protein [Acidimicrobiia bacterium]|nr:thiamine pyrophosphate-binding protein [Acidimicrobiia bacterium]
MRGHDAIARALVDQGVDTVFGLIGDANLFIADCLVREHGVRYVAATHEAAVTLMALGYGRASGQLGVGTITHGPALTNAMTALVEGVRTRSPLLLVAGDTDPADPHHLQNIGQRELVEATGAGFEQVRSGETIAADVATAVRRARHEGRPVVLDVPVDIEWLDVEYVPAPAVADLPLPSPDHEALDRAVGLIASASRPIVIAGRGAVLAGARGPLLRLADRLGAPLATTLQAQGWFRGAPFDLGIFGTLSTPLAAEAIASADCVVAFGASLNYFTTDHGALLAGKRVVQCDVVPAHVGALGPVDAGLVGDAGQVADTIVRWLDQAEHKPSGFRSPELERRLRTEATFVPSGAGAGETAAGTVDPRIVTARLDALLPAERTVAVDAGRYMYDALRISVPEPTALVTTHAFGSIGLGLAAAIGASVARPDRPCVLLVGDGGLMLGGLAELNTASQLGSDLIVVLYDDGSYGAEHIQFRNKGMDPGLSLHRWPDFARVAEAFGCTGVTVRSLEDLEAAEAAVSRRDRPLLIDVKLDPDFVSRIPR